MEAKRMKNLLLPSLAACLALCLGALPSGGGESPAPVVEVPFTWRVQTASSPEIKPDPAKWRAIDKDAFYDGLLKPMEKALGSIDQTGKRTGEFPAAIWYEQSIDVPAFTQKQALWISFQRVKGIARLYADGKFVKELWRLDREADLSGFVSPGGKASISLYVTWKGAGTDRKFSDDLVLSRIMIKGGRWKTETPRYLGIYGQTSLLVRNRDSYIKDAWVETSWEPRSIKAHVSSAGKPDPQLKVAAAVLEESGAKVLDFPQQPFSPDGVTLASPWKNPIPWQLDSPHLYKLQVSLLDKDGNKLEELPLVAFGFREVKIERQHMLINGERKPFRLSPLVRPDDIATGCGPGPVYTSLEQMLFLKRTGYNVFGMQPHHLLFFSSHTDWPIYREDFLSWADRNGIGLTASVPHFTAHWQNYGFPADPKTAAQYREEVEQFISEYRNHPSILAWIGSMNYMNSDFAALANRPEGMGQEPDQRERATAVSKTVEKGLEAISSVDPTRPAYAHASGNAGPIGTANQHMNLIPISEMEKWPSVWATAGAKPWIAVEAAFPYIQDFWLKNRNPDDGMLSPLGEFALTEFSAMFYGEDAYAKEDAKLREETLAYTRSNNATDKSFDKAFLLPSANRILADYGRRVNRAWRTWQVTGWCPWFPAWGLNWTTYNGRSPEEAMPETVAAYAETMQPLLAYIGGAPDFYLKDHIYAPGETVKKTIVIVWDGPGEASAKVICKLQSQDAKNLYACSFEPALKPGSVCFLPLELKLPATSADASLKLTMDCRLPDGRLSSDCVAFSVLAPAAPLAAAKRTALLYDPAGESAWVDTLLKTMKPNSSEALASSLKSGNPASTTLILGRNALGKLQSLPYTEEDIDAGLRVLILEQQAKDLMRLGLRAMEWGERSVFLADPRSPVAKGLSNEALHDWRGSATLLPESSGLQWWSDASSASPMKPVRTGRWGNHGNVCSVILETPHHGGFLPLLQNGFDLAYSPLLEWRYGKGGVWLCQLDLTGRIPGEPAAERLASNLLAYLETPMPEVSAAVRYDVAANLDKYRSLGFLEGAGGITVSAAPPAAPGKAFIVPDSKGSIANARAVTAISTQPLRLEGFGSIPANLLRFRLPLPAKPSSWNGLGESLLKCDPASGRVYCALAIDSASGPYKDKAEENNARLSKWRLEQLHARVLTLLGAKSSKAVAARLCSLQAQAAQDAQRGKPLKLDALELSDSFQIKGASSVKLLEEPAPKNLLWHKVDDLANQRDLLGFAYGAGKGLDPAAFIDIERLLAIKPSQDRAALLRAKFDSPEAKEFNLSIGADYWAALSLNGKEILRLDKQKTAPRIDAARIRAPLLKGENVLELKVVSGSNGFGAWLLLLDEPKLLPLAVDLGIGKAPLLGTALGPYNPAGEPSLYSEPMQRGHDPYVFYFW